MSHEYLSMAGVRPLLGRGLTAADDQPGAPDVALIGEGLWQRLFALDPSAIGRTIRLDDRPTTVVGVLPDASASSRSSPAWRWCSPWSASTGS